MSVEDEILQKMITTAKSTKKREIHVKVYAPYKTYFDESAYSVSAINDTGPFDILSGHHNFITLLNACDLVIRTSNNEKRIRISRGLMHVKADQVIVFLDI